MPEELSKEKLNAAYGNYLLFHDSLLAKQSVIRIICSQWPSGGIGRHDGFKIRCL